MKTVVLRTQKGGYDKNDVLQKIDAYQSLLFIVCDGNMTEWDVQMKSDSEDTA